MENFGNWVTAMDLEEAGAKLGCWVAIVSGLQRGGTGIKLGVLQSGELWFPEAFLYFKMSPNAWRTLVKTYPALLACPAEAHSEIKLPISRLGLKNSLSF